MKNIELKPYYSENDDFKVLALQVYKEEKNIGNLYENYDVERNEHLGWRLFLREKPIIEFETLFDVIEYLSTL